ncbi:MAG: hypothetical protein J5I53_11105 [Bradyrhizobiaceae bacterium]|nr:hypothetical protein [Bradyrhizobiaceae bacterium]
MLTAMRIVTLICMIVVGGLPLLAQSQTTGTLKLRNTQPETISLSIPTTGVTGYTVLLPPVLGAAGQTLTASNVNGTTVQLDWADASFWQLEGTAITTGGTQAGQQYLGTNNAQDLVLATNGTEIVRLIGVAGPSAGYVGFGTQTPQSLVDVHGNASLTNSGAASELRFFEPSAGGTDYTALRAGAQTGSVTYTLPPSAPAASGMVLTSDVSGAMSWQSPLFAIPNGLYTPTAGAYNHTITVGASLTANSVPIVTVINGAGTTIGVSVTGRDVAGGTITVETSVGLEATDRIAWAVLNP